MVKSGNRSGSRLRSLRTRSTKAAFSIADPALEGERLQALEGLPLGEVEGGAVLIEFLAADVRGGDEQALQAEDQVAQVVEPGAGAWRGGEGRPSGRRRREAP